MFKGLKTGKNIICRCDPLKEKEVIHITADGHVPVYLSRYYSFLSISRTPSAFLLRGSYSDKDKSATSFFTPLWSVRNRCPLDIQHLTNKGKSERKSFLILFKNLLHILITVEQEVFVWKISVLVHIIFTKISAPEQMGIFILEWWDQSGLESPRLLNVLWM